MNRNAAALAALLAATAAGAFAQDKPASPPVKMSPLIKQHYQEALAFYAEGDYRQAIAKWTEIVGEDPAQTTAPAMILDARKKLATSNAGRRLRTFEDIAAGQYRKAFAVLQAMLEQDPGDPQLQALQSRLNEVIKVAPELFPKNKASRAAMLGLKGYLALPPDLTLAHNALRYADELAPDDGLYNKLLEILVAEFPVLATLDPVTPGMKFMEYKQKVALYLIYDGKYHTAVLALDEILALDPENLTALKRLGSAYYSLGRMDKARAAWTAALRLAPGDKTLKKFIAKTRGAKAKKDEGEAGTP